MSIDLDKNIRLLASTALQSSVTPERAEQFTAHQWRTLAEIAARSSRQQVDAPRDKGEIDQVVAEMHVNKRIASRSLDDLIASYQKRKLSQ